MGKQSKYAPLDIVTTPRTAAATKAAKLSLNLSSPFPEIVSKMGHFRYMYIYTLCMCVFVCLFVCLWQGG